MKTFKPNTSELLEILTYARPHESKTEQQFLARFIDVLPNVYADAFGNRIVDVPLASSFAPRIIWSCHVDTVASKGKRQNVTWLDSDTIGLHNGKPGMSLGADDGAGVWLMLHMIREGVGGRYIFHRGEEVGRLGSLWIAENTPELVRGYDAAIAFDRRGTTDIITHQLWGRTASDAFATSLADILNTACDGLAYRPDDTGIYTDTASYVDLVGECTNVSSGYAREHGPKETLNVTHLERLARAVITADWSRLVFQRQPGEVDPADFHASGQLTDWDDWDDWARAYAVKCGDDVAGSGVADTIELENMTALVLDHPEVIAQYLLDLGVTPNDVLEEIWDQTGRYPSHLLEVPN